MRHRIANRADLDEIVAIYNATVPSRMVTADLEPISVESRLTWFEEHRPDTRPLWVVERDGSIAAWLSISSFYGRPAYRHTVEISVYVHEAHRGQGLGRYLLQAAIAHAPTIDVKTLIGFVYGHNEPSLTLFKRCGFAVWGELPRVTEMDGMERDVVILGLRVDGTAPADAAIFSRAGAREKEDG